MNKKLIALLIGAMLLIAAVSFAACAKDEDKTPRERIAEVKNSIMINATVTDNITLLSEKDGVAISWASSNTDVISNSGLVTRRFQEQDTAVTLTATLSLSGETDTKVFELTVKRLSEMSFTSEDDFSTSDGAYGTVTKNDDGTLTIEPGTLSHDNGFAGPFIKTSEYIKSFPANGYTQYALVYLNPSDTSTYIIDFSINDINGEWLSGNFLILSPKDGKVNVSDSTTPDSDFYEADEGWYMIGVRVYDNDGGISVRTFIKDENGMELKGWDIDSMGIETSEVSGPRSIWFTDINVESILIKNITISLD